MGNFQGYTIHHHHSFCSECESNNSHAAQNVYALCILHQTHTLGPNGSMSHQTVECNKWKLNGLELAYGIRQQQHYETEDQDYIYKSILSHRHNEQ